MTTIPEAIHTIALWGGINLLFMLLLGLNVTRIRSKVNVVVGAGESPELLRAIRAHGNNAEYVPGLLVAMLLLALVGYSTTVLFWIGGLLFAARLLHAHGIQRLDVDLPPTRVAGNLITWALYLGCSGALIAAGVGGG